jgi:hypothetical protein
MERSVVSFGFDGDFASIGELNGVADEIDQDLRSALSCRIRTLTKLRQLGDIRRDPSRLVVTRSVSRLSCLSLEVCPARQARNAAAACSRSSALLSLRRGFFWRLGEQRQLAVNIFDAVLFSIWRASEDCEVHDHHKIVWSTQFRLTPGSDDGAGDRGDVHDQFRTAYGIPAKRGAAVIPCGNGKCGCA